jgi:RNA polymerase sigma-70 factor, ECF subfamily
VANRAISAGLQERQHLPVDDSELAEDGGRFSQDGWWATPPVHWADEAVDRMVAPELAARVRQLVEELPPGQRQVVTLRDVEGLPSADVCGILLDLQWGVPTRQAQESLPSLRHRHSVMPP